MSGPGLLRESARWRRSPGYGGRLRGRVLGTFAAAVALALGLSAAAASGALASPASAPGGARIPALPKSGIWTAVSAGMTTESPAPALWVAPNGVGWDVFPRQIGPNNFTYEAVQIGPSGSVAQGPADILAIHWGSLQFSPTLLGDGAKPLLIFNGERGSTGVYALGCVYGALGGSPKWTVQSWTLSSNCVNPVAAAAESAPNAKVLAAAWPGGWATGTGINYRIGVSPVIPAASDDAHIALTKATAAPTGMVNDELGNGHFYVAWAQVFSTPASRDGIYVKDVTAGGAVRKAPGTGTASSSTDFPVFARLATVNRNVKGGGVYLAFCANKTPCQLELWKVGAAKAIPVPSSANALGVSLAQGPGGRIWVAWYNEQSNRVFVTRTNKAATRFGVVRSYATPCFEGGLLGLGGSPLARLDIGMQCVNNAQAKNEQFVTQVLAALTLGIPGPVHLGGSGVTVKITVTDAGDPVAGATVKVAGKTATTNAAGQASVTLPASTKPGTYKVTVTAPNYQAGTGSLTVKS